MSEWVDTLRLKLREMKILSPKENLYSKLPEVRPPLLPTRDPTRDPLPETPPVPAAIVPGIERIVNTTQTSRVTALSPPSVPSTSTPNPVPSHALNANPSTESVSSNADGSDRSQNRQNISPLRNPSESENDATSEDGFSVENISSPPISSTSNTLSQNLIKMLYPLPNFSHQSNDNGLAALSTESESDESFISESLMPENANDQASHEKTDEHLHSLARTFAANVLFDPNTSSSSKRSQNNVSNSNTPQSTGASSSNRDSAEGNFSLAIN